jgi:hypothetical protein
MVIMPTNQQAIASVCICQSLSDMLQPIYLFRYDPVNKQIFILAGIDETIEIIIPENSKIEVLNDE